MTTASAPNSRGKLGVVIRFKNSESTLPAVLEGLRRQTVQPDFVLAVNNQSADSSPALLRAAGATIVDWTEPYSHPKVLNFAFRHCPTEFVLVLSSHTVLEETNAVEKLLAAMADPRAACASGKWDDDPFYTDSIGWEELRRKGLKFCAIYSNSMGIVRRALWEQIPFDESLPTMEDGAWAVAQVKRGYVCRRLSQKFGYQRSGQSRDFIFAATTFRIAAQHGLPVAWLGVAATLRELIPLLLRPGGNQAARRSTLWSRLAARALWRFTGRPS